MILVFSGLHGAGKSHLASFIAKEFDWKMCIKRDLLKLLHERDGTGDDWVSWYRKLYALEGSYNVTRKLFDFIHHSDRLVLDSVHNLAEWKAVKECYSDAVLASVISPRAVRAVRNEPEDILLDAQRIRFWHDNNSCLSAESEWCFNGAASVDVQKIEFVAFLSYYAIQ